MTKLSYLSNEFEGPYGFCVNKELNWSAENNLKALSYFDKKIACTQKEQAFTSKGHYIFDYVPILFSSEDWFSDTTLNKNGFCDVVITDMLSKKKFKKSLQLATLVPNKGYIHGMSKQGNKQFGGLSLLIDSCLVSYEELEKTSILNHKELKFVPDLPFVDSELTYQEARIKKNERFFGGDSFNEKRAVFEETRQRINKENRYAYGLLKVEEHWMIPLENGEINELYISKYLLIQAVSETWLKENGFPKNTPILAQSGNSLKDRSGWTNGQHSLLGQEVKSKEEATLVGVIDRKRDCYFIVRYGNSGSGRFYRFNEKPKWGKNDPRPFCCINGFPLFSNDFRYYVPEN